MASDVFAAHGLTQGTTSKEGNDMCRSKRCFPLIQQLLPSPNELLTFLLPNQATTMDLTFGMILIRAQ